MKTEGVLLGLSRSAITEYRGDRMQIQTLGHASLVLYENDGTPLLLTDPWLIGSTYWRSWWLENYPDAREIERLRAVRFCYITHEHPDHFHIPSIDALASCQYFSPSLPERGIVKVLTEMGQQASELPSLAWRRLSDDVRILPIWLWNDDSILVIETRTAVVLNLNDTRPPKSFLHSVRRFRAASGKPLLLLSSYSPASLVNSFHRDGVRMTIKRKEDYVRYVNSLCENVQADYFMPFASQAIFLRSDSRWANKFRVNYEDLESGWNCKTRLLPPFCTLSLEDYSYSAPESSSYSAIKEHVSEQIAEQEALDRNCKLNDSEIAVCKRQLNRTWVLYALLYPNGILFDTRSEKILYRPWRRSLVRVAETPTNFAFCLTVPAQSLKDAINYGHVGDLGIAMFTIVDLNSTKNPWFVYGFLVLETLKDYKHASSAKAFFRWFRMAIRSQLHLHKSIPK